MFQNMDPNTARNVNNALGSDPMRGDTRARAQDWAIQQAGNNPAEFARHYEFAQAKYNQARADAAARGDRNARASADAATTPENLTRMYNNEAAIVDARERSTPLGGDMPQDFRQMNQGQADGIARQVQGQQNFDFGSTSAEVYHANKHMNEVPQQFRQGGADPISAHNNAVRDTIQNGQPVRTAVDPGSGNLQVVYHQNYPDGPREAIVFVRPDGTVTVASYGRPKAVPAGGGGPAPGAPPAGGPAPGGPAPGGPAPGGPAPGGPAPGGPDGGGPAPDGGGLAPGGPAAGGPAPGGPAPGGPAAGGPAPGGPAPGGPAPGGPAPDGGGPAPGGPAPGGPAAHEGGQSGQPGAEGGQQTGGPQGDRPPRPGDPTWTPQMQAKRDVAFDFYRERGMAPSGIDSHLDGIDFRHPVEVVTIRKGTVLEQFQVQGGRQGSYYSEGGVAPTQLGINPQGQVLGPDRQPLLGADGQPIIADKIVTRWLVTEDVQVLRSQAGAITDTWSVPGQAFETSGGAVQMYSPERNKFQQLPPVAPPGRS